MNRIKVAVFDDNKHRRMGLELLINSTSKLSCVGAFEDCRDVLKNIQSCFPNVVLMDIDMPHVNGVEGVKLISTNFPEIKILMQTVFEDDEKIFASICAGAHGYILKKTPPQKLIESIFDVMEGGAPMTPSIARQVLHLFYNQNKRSSRKDFDLSEREHEILTLLVEGLSYKMIADHCKISFNTVNTHISHIYRKLQVNSVAEAIKKAMDQKLVG